MRPVMKHQALIVSVTMHMLIIIINLCCSVKLITVCTHLWNHILVVIHTHVKTSYCEYDYQQKLRPQNESVLVYFSWIMEREKYPH